MTDECEKTTKFELDEKSTAESHGNREQMRHLEAEIEKDKRQD